MEQNQTYTVFCDEVNGTPGFWSGCKGECLESVIATVAGQHRYFTLIPTAWTTGEIDLRDWEGAKDRAIAAGRLIEKVDGKYVARGIHSPMIATAPEEKLASVKVCEEKGEGRVENFPVRVSIDPATGRTVYTPVYRNLEVPPLRIEAEKRRPRLTWADTKPFNNFEGYEVTSGSSDVLHTLADGVHPLQKMAEGKEGFGSAALLKG